jgi:UDP-glucose 6-dehydrogenase
MRVTVIGSGSVGTVTGACLAYLGHKVTCVDTDSTKIAELQRREMPIYEPHLAELLGEAAVRGGIDFTTELSQAAADYAKRAGHGSLGHWGRRLSERDGPAPGWQCQMNGPSQ